MAHAEVPSEGIVSAEGLLLGAQVTPHLLLAGIVDGILVPREVVRAREDRVAGLAGRGVDAFTAVGPFLCVAHSR